MSDRVRGALMELHVAASQRAGKAHLNNMRCELSLPKGQASSTYNPRVTLYLQGLVRRAKDGSLGRPSSLPTPDGMAVLAAMFKHLEINRVADRARRTT